jgi:hypothetical protein
MAVPAQVVVAEAAILTLAVKPGSMTTVAVAMAEQPLFPLAVTVLVTV